MDLFVQIRWPSRVYWDTLKTNATARILYGEVADRGGVIQYRKLF